jgi:putative ABC transport system permease protein
MTVGMSFKIALKALGRNKMQTALTMLGMIIGVAAVLTMVALGTGAQTSIEEEVLAAGANVITITAGNYKAKTGGGTGPAAGHGAELDEIPFDPAGRLLEEPQIVLMRGPAGLADFVEPTVWYEDDVPGLRLIGHPEDDPMEKHDHPTAAQRLGDSQAGLGSASTLTSDDADFIRFDIKGIKFVVPGINDNARFVFGDKQHFSRVEGTGAELAKVRSWKFRHGRFFDEDEDEDAEQVAVLGSVVSEKLFGKGVDPTGEEIKIWNQPFEVVGVIATRVRAQVGDNESDAVYVPATTVQTLLNLVKLNSIIVATESAGETSRVADEITELLRYHHNIGFADPDDFTIRTQAREVLAKGLLPEVARVVVGNVPGLEAVTLEELSMTLEQASKTMTALLACIAGVSLLVGGIGIMNIMLVSVTERTREIGIRMAVGARARDVLMQFLVEAVTLSVIGGVAGIILGYAAAGGIQEFLQWSTQISFGAVAFAFGIAAAVGVFFGFYPARQAARLDPIEALRYQ